MTNNRGEIGLAGAIGCAILLIAYAMFPGLFHSFFSSIIDLFRNAVGDNFGPYGNDPSPNKNPQLARPGTGKGQ